MTAISEFVRRVGRPVKRWSMQQLLDLQAPLSVRYFNNHRWLAENIRYNRYHQVCRQCWKPKTFEPSPEAESLRNDGYVVIPPTRERNELAKRIEQAMDKCMQDRSNIIPRYRDAHNPKLADAVTLLPRVIELLEGTTERALEFFYGSNFKIYYVSPRRSTPIEGDLYGHWMWHSDNDPDPILKVMVYLTDVTEKQGPFTTHDLAGTRDLFRAGFRDRHKVESLRAVLEDDGSYRKFTGQAGTTVIFDNNLIHRGWPVVEGHRDVVVFMVLPSMEPWRDHVQRMGNKLSLNHREHPTPLHPADE